MNFKPIKTLPLEQTLSILEQFKNEDLIKEEVEKEEAFLKNRNCIKCGSTSLIKVPQMIVKEFEGEMIREPIFNSILPKNYLKCNSCNCEFDPYLGLITSLQ